MEESAERVAARMQYACYMLSNTRKRYVAAILRPAPVFNAPNKLDTAAVAVISTNNMKQRNKNKNVENANCVDLKQKRIKEEKKWRKRISTLLRHTIACSTT